MEIEIHILHLLGGDIQLVVGQAHHAALIHLELPLANLLRIATVGHTHITGEAQLDREIRMLRLVAGKAQSLHASLVDVVGSSTDAIFRVVAPGGQGLDLGRVECHHLP